MYKYIPTRKGFRYTSVTYDDPIRNIIRPLYPECRKETVFTADEMEKLDSFQLRVLICARMAPCYTLDMHSLAGMAGYGRFVIVRDGIARYADECANIETEYVDGTMVYILRDPIIENGELSIQFVPTFGMIGVSIKITRSNVPVDTEIYLLQGGMTGWNPHTPSDQPYCDEACACNCVNINNEFATISLTDHTGKLKPLHAPAPQENSAWLLLDGWHRQVIVRISDGSWFTADPKAMYNFDKQLLQETYEKYECLLCGRIADAEEVYIVTGRGFDLPGCDVKQVFEYSIEKNKQISERLIIHSDDEYLDSAVHIASYATEAMFGGSVFTHGVYSWRDAYLGWRNVYGPLAYGMMDQARKHFDTHFKKSLIIDGPDAGALMHKLEDAKPDATMFYSMYETFMHQARRYYEYTGDKQFADSLAPVLDGCIQRSIRRLKPGKEWLFENCVNTWISDSHWSRMGQCTQSSAYTYDMMQLASEIMPDSTRRNMYADIAKKIKKDAHDVLWLKRKGIFAYCRDLIGNHLMHEEPELADIYHSSEMGLADPLESYQMLDWVEANLKQERADNGGKLFWSSNWHPNSGDTYTHSTYEMALGEEFNLSLIYGNLGLYNEGYEIFRSAYTAIFGGEKCNVWDHDDDKYIEAGLPRKISEIAGGFPGQIHINGTLRRGPEFSDCISMLGRSVYEGIAGISPKRNLGVMSISPRLPDSIRHLQVSSCQADYTYKRTDESISLAYTVYNSSFSEVNSLIIIFAIPVSCDVTVEGGEMEITPGFGNQLVKIHAFDAGQGMVCVNYKPLDVLPIEERREFMNGENIHLNYVGEKIFDVIDPQGIITNVVIDDGSFTATIAGNAGSGVFFLKMASGYYRPVKVMIREEKGATTFQRLNDFEMPHQFETIDIDELFNASSPEEILHRVSDNVSLPSSKYNQVNTQYYKDHLIAYNHTMKSREISCQRWHSMVGDDGIAITGEGIPFRSKRDGKFLAAAVVENTAYPDRFVKNVRVKGRALYMMVTGITFPMQSHVENVRVTLCYSDGTEISTPLVNPFNICDGWFTLWSRFHDSTGCGFENLRGKEGALSSAGLDLNVPIATDTEAEILCFPLEPDKELLSVEFRMIALDSIFCLMGLTVLK